MSAFPSINKHIYFWVIWWSTLCAYSLHPSLPCSYPILELIGRRYNVFRSILDTLKRLDQYSFSRLIFSSSATEMTSCYSRTQIPDPALWCVYLNQGFSASAPLRFWVKVSLLCPIHSGTFLPAPLVANKNISRCCQVFPLGQKCLNWELFI